MIILVRSCYNQSSIIKQVNSEVQAASTAAVLYPLSPSVAHYRFVMNR